MDGGEEDFTAELEGLDITACKEKITLVLAEQERRRESTARLQEKLKALNYELAARREEADRQRRVLSAEVARHRREADEQRLRGREDAQAMAPAAEGEQRDKVRRFVERELLETVVRHPPINELGVRIFDERDLMVEKPVEVERREAALVDTVLITHWKPSNLEQKFHLSYRVACDTTSRTLREDACLYWGLSEVEYILWTLNNSKVHDDLLIQSCFRPGEEAHLILAAKTPKKTEPPERIGEAIRPKVGMKARKKVNVSAKASPATGEESKNDNFFEQMAKVPGLFEFMTQRDRAVTSHVGQIRPFSIGIYLTLLLTTAVSMGFMKAPNMEYVCRLGVYAAMTEAGPVRFLDVSTRADVWRWLAEVVPAQLLAETSTVRRQNYLPGWLRLRVQRVNDAPRKFCTMGGNVPGGFPCLSETYSADTAGNEDLPDVEAFWQAGADGRSNVTVPWRYSSHAVALAAAGAEPMGALHDFDASGYAADWDLQFPSLSVVRDAYVADLQNLKEADWINNRTRAVHLSFVAYNANYDYWLMNAFTFEMPASGVVQPAATVQPYRLVLDSRESTLGHEQLGLDVCRLVFCLYILLFQIQCEVKGTWARGFGCDKYLLRPLGLADIAIAALFLVVFLQRYLIGALAGPIAVTSVDDLRDSYQAESVRAHHFHQNMVLEAFVLALVTFRLVAFARINRQVFLIWQTLNVSIRRYLGFLLVFAMVIGSFVVVAHALFRAYLPEYGVLAGSFASTIIMLLGEMQSQSLCQATRPWTQLYAMLFYIVVVLFFVNTWAAVLVQEYQKIRVATGYRPSDYRWTEYEYVSWLLPSLPKRLYCKMRPHIVPIPDDEDDGP